MLEADDFLVVLRYNIDYGNGTNQPDYSATYTFNAQLLDGDTGEILGNVTPYSFHDYGYGQGMAAIYLDADSAPEWGGNHTVRIIGSSLFDTPPSVTETLTAGNYAGSLVPSVIREELRLYILEELGEVESAWGIDEPLMAYTYDGPVLAAAGQAYMTGVIEDLTTMVPLLFLLQYITPDIVPREHDLSLQEDLRDKYSGTPAGDALEALGEMLGVDDFQVVTSIGTILAMIALMIYCGIKWKKAGAGLLIGLPGLLISADASMFSMVILGLLTFVCILHLAYMAFFRQSAG